MLVTSRSPAKRKVPDAVMSVALRPPAIDTLADAVILPTLSVVVFTSPVTVTPVALVANFSDLLYFNSTFPPPPADAVKLDWDIADTLSVNSKSPPNVVGELVVVSSEPDITIE